MAKKGYVSQKGNAKLFFVMSVLCCVLSPSVLLAQSANTKPHKQYSMGVLVGRISGLTLKMKFLDVEERFHSTTPSVDVNLTTNFDDNVLWSAHILRERHLQESPLKLFIGPGLTAGLNRQEAFWGVSGTIGFMFTKGPYEVFLQGMPRLYLMPKMDGRIEAATGIRVAI